MNFPPLIIQESAFCPGNPKQWIQGSWVCVGFDIKEVRILI